MEHDDVGLKCRYTLIVSYGFFEPVEHARIGVASEIEVVECLGGQAARFGGGYGGLKICVLKFD